ncbi:hypothetical protein [Streptomyces malaysiensis]|uniref:hypothetical protein n=1 Tax=Streptomyces malaysiensis TaxID=92644 RepID=UPI0036957D9D
MVDADADHVTLTRDGDTVSGSVDRVDVTLSPEAPIVLTSTRSALLFDAEALTAGPVLRRRGLDGACTTPLALSGVVDTSVHELGVDGTAVRNGVRLGAAAVAAGTASGAVAESATYAAGRHQFGRPDLRLRRGGGCRRRGPAGPRRVRSPQGVPGGAHVRDAVSLRAAVDAAGIAVSEAARLVGMP